MKGKVLYVDDHAPSRLMYKNLLANVGVECITVGFVDEARKKFEEDDGIRLLIVDYMLGHESVSDFTNEVREKIPALPIIVLTGQEGPAWERVKEDKILVYDVMLHKKSQITNASIVDIVTSFLETNDYEVFKKFKYVWALDDKNEEVELAVVSRNFPSLIVCVDKRGKLEFKGSHFIFEKNLGDFLVELQKITLWLLKKVDLSKIENLPEDLVAAQMRDGENPDRILAAIMGSTRSTIQRQTKSIDEQSIREKRIKD
jgi:CheY-like chemotaxis protein